MSFAALRTVFGHVARVNSQALMRQTIAHKGLRLGARSLWSISNSGQSHLFGSSSIVAPSSFNTSTVHCVHTTGDKDLTDFLKDEIKLEKESEKSSGKIRKIKGFEVTKSDGPNVVLTRKSENETITIKFNVNNTLEDSLLGMDKEGQDDQQPEMVSKPAFVVEINKGGEQTLALHCVFPPSDEAPPQEQDPEVPYEDLIEIQDVTLLSKSQEWTEDVYSLSGNVMDGNLYDMLLKLLEERGIDGDFLDQLIEWSTSYEHKKYIGLLEQLKDFTSSK